MSASWAKSPTAGRTGLPCFPRRRARGACRPGQDEKGPLNNISRNGLRPLPATASQKARNVRADRADPLGEDESA